MATVNVAPTPVERYESADAAYTSFVAGDTLVFEEAGTREARALMILVRPSAGGTITVTGESDLAVTVASGVDTVVGPGPSSVFQQPDQSYRATVDFGGEVAVLMSRIN